MKDCMRIYGFPFYKSTTITDTGETESYFYGENYFASDFFWFSLSFLKKVSAIIAAS